MDRYIYGGLMEEERVRQIESQIGKYMDLGRS